MQGIELSAFNIIAAVGEARTKCMQAVEESRKGKEEIADELIKKANQLLTQGDKEHFKIISHDSKNHDVKFSMLLVHAEDQLMAAEIIRDIAQQLVITNLQLFNCQKQMK